MPTDQETQAATAAMAANNPFQPPAQAQPMQGQGQQPPNGQQPQGSQTPPPHPDFQKPPAREGEHRTANIWIPPDEWAQTQTELRQMREWKQQNDQLLEMKEAERIRAMAEKGQIEAAFAEMKAIHEKKAAELAADKQRLEQNWLNEKKNQVISEVLAGKTFIGDTDEARGKMANLVREFLANEIEAVIVNGAPFVRDKKTLRPASDYLHDRLTSDKSELIGLLAPKKPSGGSGTDGTRPLATPSIATATPLSPEETVNQWQRPGQQPMPALGLHSLQKRA